jgi:ribosome biogenesis GTPase A
MWPKIAHEADGYMLAASHAIGRNAVIDSEVGAFLGALLLQRYPGLVDQRYGFASADMDGIGVVEAVAKKRGCMTRTRRGMETDLEKAAMVLLTDYREGRLGRISLETPQSRAAMLAASSSASPPG